jgi:hypothetical protein
MELTQFVTDVLTAIMAAVQGSESIANQYGAAVNPRSQQFQPGSHPIGSPCQW